MKIGKIRNGKAMATEYAYRIRYQGHPDIVYHKQHEARQIVFQRSLIH